MVSASSTYSECESGYVYIGCDGSTVTSTCCADGSTMLCLPSSIVEEVDEELIKLAIEEEIRYHKKNIALHRDYDNKRLANKKQLVFVPDVTIQRMKSLVFNARERG